MGRSSVSAAAATYVRVVITDDELAAAVAGRAHWQPAGDTAAVYAAPGSAVTVRVQRIHQPTSRERYMCSVVRDGRAAYTMPCGTAAQAVRWSERVRSG